MRAATTWITSSSERAARLASGGVRVDVILPVLDEAESLPGVLGRLPDGYRALVVDNDSSDGSAEVARALGAEVVHEPRRGFGAACWTGLCAATSEVVCFMDADGSLDAADLPCVAGPVLEQAGARLVLGRRRPVGPGAWPWHARVANRGLAFELGRRTGVRLHDIGPMRAAPRAALLDLGILDRRFGWPLEMVLRASGAGWTVDEVDVAYRPRTGGRSKVTGSFRGSVRAIRDMAGVLA